MGFSRIKAVPTSSWQQNGCKARENRSNLAQLLSGPIRCEGPRAVAVLRRLPTARPDRLTELLPDGWFRVHSQAASKRAA